MNFRQFLVSGMGILKYGPGLKAVVLIDPEIAKYSLALIPKYKNIQPQKYSAHITVVRLEKETPQIEFWGKHEGEKVPFEYDAAIKSDGIYYFLDAYSKRIGDIREELGLSRYRVGFRSYHISLGNIKE